MSRLYHYKDYSYERRAEDAEGHIYWIYRWDFELGYQLITKATKEESPKAIIDELYEE